MDGRIGIRVKEKESMKQILANLHIYVMRLSFHIVTHMCYFKI
jgi:hypothetical protein